MEAEKRKAADKIRLITIKKCQHLQVLKDQTKVLKSQVFSEGFRSTQTVVSMVLKCIHLCHVSCQFKINS